MTRRTMPMNENKIHLREIPNHESVMLNDVRITSIKCPCPIGITQMQTEKTGQELGYSNFPLLTPISSTSHHPCCCTGPCSAITAFLLTNHWIKGSMMHEIIIQMIRTPKFKPTIKNKKRDKWVIRNKGERKGVEENDTPNCMRNVIEGRCVSVVVYSWQDFNWHTFGRMHTETFTVVFYVGIGGTRQF